MTTATAAVALTLLEPWFLRHELRTDTWERARPDGTLERVTGPREYNVRVDTLAEAQGVVFLCPKCYADNGGPTGTHSVLCWFKDRGVPPEATPGPARWAAAGSAIDDLTLVPSVLITSGCGWHGHIHRGKVTSCG